MVDRDVIVGQFRRLLDRLRTRRRVRHAVVGVAATDGSWRWVAAAGRAAPGGAPMRSATPWFLASVTKLYIAAVVLRLHEQGLVSLDEPVAAYLPQHLATGLHVLDGVDFTDQLTLVHLLGHLSGLPDWLDERPKAGRSWFEELDEAGDRDWSHEDAVRHARDRLAPHFRPSDPAAARPRIRYSDTNYQLLMVVAEHVTGEPMASLYDKLLFQRLELTGTWLPGDSPPARAERPAAVWVGDRPLERPRAMASFGDLYATTDDVLTFVRAWAGGALFDDPATQALVPRRFHTFGLPTSVAALAAPSWPIEYGMGVMRFAPPRILSGGRRIPPLLGHTGATGSWAWHVPELGLVTAGTVDQTSAVAVPFTLVPRTLAACS